MSVPITIEIYIEAPIEKIWQAWTDPSHITQWAFASDDWCCPHAENNLFAGGSFATRMESKDTHEGFDFSGVYTAVEEYKHIAYTIEGGRKVTIDFIPKDSGFLVVESFDPEDENPIDMQKYGWQCILDNFKKHVESEI